MKRFGEDLWYESELCCFAEKGIRKGTGRENGDIFCDWLYLLTPKMSKNSCRRKYHGLCAVGVVE